MGNKDLSQLLSLQNLEVDHAIGITINPLDLATAIGPELHTKAGPRGPSGVIPILTPFFAFLTKPNNTTYMIQDIIKKVTKIKPKLSTTGGTSDARFIRKIAPCLEFGLVGKTMHKVDEAVSLSDLKKLTLIYSIILKNYFK